MMTRTTFSLAALAAVGVLAVGTPASAMTITSDGGGANNARDTNNDGIGDNTVDPSRLNVRAFNPTPNNIQVGVISFELAPLAPGETYDTASLTLDFLNVSGNPPYNVDLYGLTRSPTAGPGAIAADYFEGALDATNTLIADNFVTTATPTGSVTTDASANTNLVAFLNANATTGPGQFVLFRINNDADESGVNNRGYQFGGNAAGDDGNQPTLTFTTIPEPASLALLGLGGLMLLARRKRSA